MSFVLYALFSLLIGIIICIFLISMVDRYRINLNYKYENMSTRYDIPENGSFTATYSNDQTKYTIFDTKGNEICKFNVDYQKERPVHEYVYPNHVSYIEVLEDIDIPRQQITFHSLIDNFNNTAEALCYDKHFSITASGDNITLFINLDTVMQIYENLLSNSIRYAKSDIAISVVIENNNLVISVSDDGCGFKNIEIEKATLPFYKSSKDISTEHLGLGLNISKILSERHGGNIQIANNKAGGACVTVKINCNES